MRRLTAELVPLGSTVDSAGLRTEVNRLLLHARRPMTFRLGDIGVGEGGVLLVEIAADTGREALLSLLKPLEDTVSVHVRQIGWGWPITAAKERSGQPREMSGPLRGDPYCTVAAQKAPEKSYVQGRRQVVRRIASLALTAGMVVAIAGILFRASLEREWLADHEASITLLWFSIWWLWVFLRVPLIPFRRSAYVTRITCDPEGVEVRDWFHRGGRRLMWRDIWGLDLRYEECVVRANGRTLSFPTSDVLGPRDLPMLIKTILERSALLFVGGKMSPLQYRRFSAPS